MRVKPWVAFRTDLPDDQVDTEQDIAVFGGRNVAVAIGEIFARLGCEVGEPKPAGENGWEFALKYKERHRFWCQVNSTSYPVFRLLFENMTFRSRAAQNAAAHAELAVTLDAALKKSPLFHDVSWWSLKEGPPDDEIDLAEAKKQARNDPSSPISAAGKPFFVPAWMSLIFGVWMLLTGGGILQFWFSEFRAGDPVVADLAVGLLILGIGALAVRAAVSRGVFR